MVIYSLWVGAAFAQTYPDYKSTTVNDYAHLLSEAQERKLSARLSQLKRDTGVEMTVLTLASQSFYAPDQTMEQFATGLFNHWGIGDSKRNDGVLVLVLRDDRAMRVELGAAFARDWDAQAVRVIDTVFLPAFRSDDYGRGILEGSDAVISDIVVPFKDGAAAPGNFITDNWFFWLFGVLFIGSGLHSNRAKINDLFARFRKCPKCGRRGLRADRSVSIPPTSSLPGRGRHMIFCVYCDHREDTDYVIASLSVSSSSGRFGGGRSGGGGGSGRW